MYILSSKFKTEYQTPEYDAGKIVGPKIIFLKKLRPKSILKDFKAHKCSLSVSLKFDKPSPEVPKFPIFLG
jgi:hypothetical protein